MNRSDHHYSVCRAALQSLPLTLCLIATALVLQRAYALQSVLIADDELTAGLLGFVHPAAKVFLLAGYAVSAAAVLYPALSGALKKE